MVEGIVDTAIFVDYLRGLPEARDWLEPREDLGITPIVWLELLQGLGEIDGSKNRQKLTNLTTFLQSFALVETTASDVLWARDRMIQLRLSHDIGAMDFLIASTAYRLGLPVYTRNMKDFQPLLGDLATRPY